MRFANPASLLIDWMLSISVIGAVSQAYLELSTHFQRFTVYTVTIIKDNECLD